MEYILELNDANQLTLPEAIVADLGLHAGAHFSAKVANGRFIIERLPFSSFEQNQSLNRTVESLQK